MDEIVMDRMCLSQRLFLVNLLTLGRIFKKKHVRRFGLLLRS